MCYGYSKREEDKKKQKDILTSVEEIKQEEIQDDQKEKDRQEIKIPTYIPTYSS